MVDLDWPCHTLTADHPDFAEPRGQDIDNLICLEIGHNRGSRALKILLLPIIGTICF